LAPTKPERQQRRDRADLDKSPDWCQPELQPPAHYRTVATRARQLQAEVTTLRLKQYLSEIIERCEQLAGEVGAVSENGSKVGHSAAPPARHGSRTGQMPWTPTAEVRLDIGKLPGSGFDGEQHIASVACSVSLR
jgi:hypothetical protein